MLRTRPLVAATLVAALAGPTAWTILRERAPEAPPAPEAGTPQPGVPEPALPKPGETKAGETRPGEPAPKAPPVPAPTARTETVPAPPPEVARPAPPPSPAVAPLPPAVLAPLARPAPLALPPPPAPARPLAIEEHRRVARDQSMAMLEPREAPRTRALSAGAVATLAAPRHEPAPLPEPTGRDRFPEAQPSGFQAVAQAPVSTFSIDVDTASYAFVRASLNRNALPPPNAVRTEELINYFPYAYPAPTGPEEPFRITTAVFPSPWADGRKLVQVAIKGYAVAPETRPAANLVFLVDTSGSMAGPNRLPLVKQSLALLLTQLDGRDRVAIVSYAGQAGTVLPPTPASERQTILGAIEGLGAGGGTAGGEGLRQAYALAEQNFAATAVNRVVLATDGDFNLGITDRDELKGFIARKRETGIFLSVLGFGMGNHNDALMQALAQEGNGAAAYIDTLNEARKVLVEEATSTLVPIAKDVKIQVEFNPATIAEYRLIGYETRALRREDFANDKVDASEVGSGQAVTALYEVVPVGGPRVMPALRYGATPAAPAAASGDYAHVAIRYKRPDAETSQLIEASIDPSREVKRLADAPQEARFAAAVAAFGEILRGGTYTGRFGYDDVARLAAGARGDDPFGYRAEFVALARAAKSAAALAPAPR
ncbi:VWA domain-containing protein [Methylobacterium nonmethylotrophicum]|uniref:VWA domain-containing protein n=2 Tax=Methylobacterium nonmethylotrophicum TaxID=1141884 RepID=A0A4Z0NRL5_9HYPH|nr:VWA domain-containing protein [Methylobacterium nonmethylotrophicum]TGD99489.1 VWA domain-containing protein [Methylobacterium nonmethylotrophicum]